MWRFLIITKPKQYKTILTGLDPVKLVSLIIRARVRSSQLVWQLNNFIIYPVLDGRPKQGIGEYSQFMNYFSAIFIKGI